MHDIPFRGTHVSLDFIQTPNRQAGSYLDECWRNLRSKPNVKGKFYPTKKSGATRAGKIFSENPKRIGGKISLDPKLGKRYNVAVCSAFDLKII